MRSKTEARRPVVSRRAFAASAVLVGVGAVGAVTAQAAVQERPPVPAVPVVHVGGGDITRRLQQAFDRIPAGGAGRIVIPAGVHRITRPVTAVGKTIALEMRGTVKDSVRSWEPDFLSKRLDDKGLLAFRRCRVTITGVGSGHHFDGSAREPGLAGIGRTMLFFDRCRIEISRLRTKASSGATIQGFGNSGVRYRDCRHEDAGQYGVFFVGGRDYRISRIVMRGSFLGALSVNRTGYGLALNRPQNVRITDCDIRGYTATNNYAGGIVVNEGDHVRATGNVSDGMGKGSFAYSFAGCSDVYSRNTALNMSNNTVGSYGYAGVAFELDGVKIGDFDDVMTECIGGYLLADNRNVKLAGTYRCDVGRTRRLDSEAGKTGMFMIANTVKRSRNIRITGAVCDGGNSFITGAMAVDRLAIRDVRVRDTFYSVINFEGGSVRGLTVEGLRYRDPGAAPSSVVQAADGVLDGITVIDSSAVTALPSRGKAFFSADAPGATLRFSRLSLSNLGAGIDDRYGRARSLILTDSRFTGVPRPLTARGTRTRSDLSGSTFDGDRVQPSG